MKVMRVKDAFKLLGLEETAPFTDVVLAWRQRRGAAHPDQGGTAAEFHRLKQAYDMASRHAMLPKKCDACGGTGKKAIAKGFTTIRLNCPTCRGSGLKGEHHGA